MANEDLEQIHEKALRRFERIQDKERNQRMLAVEDIKFAQVIKTEENGSDVNLAVHLLNDAWLNEYD